MYTAWPLLPVSRVCDTALPLGLLICNCTLALASGLPPASTVVVAVTTAPLA
ncbi:hypothetical protein D3C71_1784850 [compost metagenome]